MDQEATPRDRLSEKVIGLAIEVHRALGPGLLESAYEECPCLEMSQHALGYSRQVPLGLTYKGLLVEAAYRVDLLIENRLIVELKTVERILPLHEAQLLTYLKLSGLKVGLLLNFNVHLLKDGIRRMVL
jgi:GxxExxY protein